MKHESVVEALSHILVTQNVWKPENAETAQKLFKNRSASSFVNFLLDEGLVSRAQLLNALSTYYRVPAFDVTGYFFDHELLKKFPKDFLLRNFIIPLEVDQNMLIVIAANPNDSDLLPRLGGFVSYDIQFMVGIDADIADAVKEYYDLSPAILDEDSDVKDEERTKKQAERIEIDE